MARDQILPHALLCGDTELFTRILSMSSLLFFVFLPLLLLIAVVDVLTMGTERRVRVWRRAGLSQAAIAAKLGISRYRVRQLLAA